VKRDTVSSGAVLAALRNGPFREPLRKRCRTDRPFGSRRGQHFIVRDRADQFRSGKLIPVNVGFRCEWCACTVELNRSIRSHGEPRFCSNICNRLAAWQTSEKQQACAMRGKVNPQWKGDHASAQAGRERARSIYRRVGPCDRCGRSPAERHHSDGNTLNNEPRNVDLLCRRCHMQEDGRASAFMAARSFSGQRRGRLTEDDARRIRERVATGATRRSMAAEYGVSATTIRRVVRRESFGWVS